MLVLIADSHVTAGEAQAETFFAMLEALSKTTHDVLFLGDNLDIWIASAPKYQSEMHERFLAWCRREKERRKVMLVEGNHEFYVCRHFRDCFTECSEGVLRYGGMTFVHGDVTQKALGFHRLFRLFAKNGFGDFVMSWLPGGVAFAARMKRLLSNHRPPPPGMTPEQMIAELEKRDYIPYKAVDGWVERECRVSGGPVFMGHFHLRVEREVPGGRYMVVPAWKYQGIIGLLDLATRRCTLGRWQELLTEAKDN